TLDPEGLPASAARRFYEDELLRNDPEALAFLTRELMAEWWPPRDEPGLTFDGVWLPDLMPVTKGILLRLDVVEYLGIVLRALDGRARAEERDPRDASAVAARGGGRRSGGPPDGPSAERPGARARARAAAGVAPPAGAAQVSPAWRSAGRDRRALCARRRHVEPGDGAALSGCRIPRPRCASPGRRGDHERPPDVRAGPGTGRAPARNPVAAVLRRRAPRPRPHQPLRRRRSRARPRR